MTGVKVWSSVCPSRVHGHVIVLRVAHGVVRILVLVADEFVDGH